MTHGSKKTKEERVCKGQLLDVAGIPVPNDIIELAHIPELIDQIPLYIEKITEMKKEVEEFSKLAAKQSFVSTRYEIDNLIYRAFFIQLENRKYDIKEMRSIRGLPVISNRNPSCEICGENRSIDKCHIIPAKFGGTCNSDNIIILCPTHHRLLDRFMLSKQEYASINWLLKSKPSQHYADKILLENHKKFWIQVENNNNSPIRSYENKEWLIYKYALEEIIHILRYSNTISRKSLFNVLDGNIKAMSKGIVRILLKEEILWEDSNKHFLILAKPDFQASDDLAIKCWGKLN